MSGVLQQIRQTYLAQQEQDEEQTVAIVAHVRRGGRGFSSGNPTGSAVGKCTAQLQLLRQPEISHPDPFPLRSQMVFEGGHMVEAWWGQAIQAAFPNLSGMANELFYFPVPLDEADFKRLWGRVPDPDYRGRRKPGMIWGTKIGDFQPPKIEWDAQRQRPRISHLIPREQRSQQHREQRLKALPANLYENCLKAGLTPAVIDALLGIPQLKPQPIGFVLDIGAKCVWVPTYVDRILMHPEHGGIAGGLVVLEKKAVSTPSFRRALMGRTDLELRCQMVTFVEATKLPVAWLFYRKETAHLLEIFYDPVPGFDERTRVTLTRPNGSQEAFYVDGEKLVNDEGRPADNTGDLSWETAETWTPYDTDLLEVVHDNVRRVLLSEGPDPKSPAALTQWLQDGITRRYGPSFECKICEGTKVQSKNKTNGEPLKKAKPCEDCLDADGKPTGILERVQLPVFPCGYCSVVKRCWQGAGLEIEITDKPRHFVTRAKFEASGIVVTPFARRDATEVFVEPAEVAT